MTKTRNIFCSFQHTVEKSSFLQMDSVHTFYIELTFAHSFSFVSKEMFCNIAYIIDDCHHRCEVTRCRSSESPYIRSFTCEFSVRHARNTVRYITVSTSTYTKEFVRCEVGYIYTPVFNIYNGMWCMLYCVTYNVDVRIDLFGTSCNFLDIHDISGNVGSSHDA